MSMTAIKLKPSLLVALATRLEPSGVRYDRKELGKTTDASGREITVWETTKVIEDPEEYERAIKTRSDARSLIRSACVWTPFGLMCVLDNETVLEAKIAEANELIREFNTTAKTCRVRLNILPGRIAENKAEAVAAIRDEVGGLLAQMQEALKLGEVKTVRDLCNRATQMKRLMDTESQAPGMVDSAIAAARKMAREIVSRVEKGGEALADVLEESALSPIQAARFVFVEEAAQAAEETADQGAGLAAVTVLPRFAGLAEPEEEETEAEPTDEHLAHVQALMQRFAATGGA